MLQLSPHLPARPRPCCRNPLSRRRSGCRFPARATAPASPRFPAATPGISPAATAFRAGNRKCPDASKKQTPPTVRSSNHWRPRADRESCVEKNISARPAALITIFTTFGLSSSAGFLMRVAAVDISFCASAFATASITDGSINGSSPWMFTTASHSQRSATSAMRSEPLGCSGRVISTRQKFCATSQMRVSSVATMISESDFAFWHCSTTC